MTKEIWKIKLRPKYAKVNGEEILDEVFESKNDAEIFFESEGMDYDYYHIYKTLSK